MSEWATLENARMIWSDAPSSDALLNHLLNVSQELCEAYAPALGAGDPVPARYMQAVVQQARETWQNSERDGDVIGFDGDYAIRVRPLAETVKQLLRPRTGIEGWMMETEAGA